MNVEHESAFSEKEVKEILEACGADALLVGGQALAFWALHYDVERPEELVAQITSDVDFVGSGALAADLGKRLGWKVFLPTLDDATSQTGKVSKTLANGGVKQIDFLSGVVGLDTAAVEKRAAESTWPGSRVKVRVMHPLDVLMSRIKNLEVLPDKRNATGAAQARLAVRVAGAFLTRLVKERNERRLLDAVERVVDIAKDPAALKIHARYGIDPLLAIPLAEMESAKFQKERWPRVLADVDRRRRALMQQYEKAQQRSKPAAKTR